MFDARVRPYYCTKMIANEWKLEIIVQGTQNMPKTEILAFVRAACAENARTDAYARKFLKCSKWSETCPKQFLGRLEHFEILARARGRVMTRARNYVTSFDRE